MSGPAATDELAVFSSVEPDMHKKPTYHGAALHMILEATLGLVEVQVVLPVIVTMDKEIKVAIQ